MLGPEEKRNLVEFAKLSPMRRMPVLVDGDRAVVEWRAETRLKDSSAEKLAGVSLLRFDEKGLVVEQRDFWGSA